MRAGTTRGEKAAAGRLLDDGTGYGRSTARVGVPAAQAFPLHAHRFGRDADVDVMVEDRTGDHVHGADHGAVAHRHPREDHGMVGDPRAVADHRAAAGHALDVFDVVVVGVYVGVVRDRHVAADDDLAAVIEQDFAV